MPVSGGVKSNQMLYRLAAIAFLCLPLLAANIKLFLKDGTYHVVREYKVEADRVNFYSIERSEWEEIPLDLVDLKKTEAEIQARQTAERDEAKAIAAEEKAERDQRREIARIPEEPGAYYVSGAELKPLPQAVSKVNNNKRRSILKAVSPIPIVAGKATVELDGDQSAFAVSSGRPEFYFRLAAEERFGIIKLTPAKNARVVEKWTIIPVTKEIIQEQDTVETFRHQVGDGLYKIWPAKPLEPGEYAIVEYTEGKGNTQVWDFTVPAAAKR
jgi:hypothetical protein